jgi:death-on-curing protein
LTPAEPHWLGRLAVDEAPFRQIREHGGSHGLRDENALESALARPRHRWLHDEDVGIAQLAAACAFAIARNHPYVDGNKRVALVAMVAILDRNGSALTATNGEILQTILELAAGELTENVLGFWIDRHSRPG